MLDWGTVLAIMSIAAPQDVLGKVQEIIITVRAVQVAQPVRDVISSSGKPEYGN
jgi:hypothetical protein